MLFVLVLCLVVRASGLARQRDRLRLQLTAARAIIADAAARRRFHDDVLAVMDRWEPPAGIQYAIQVEPAKPKVTVLIGSECGEVISVAITPEDPPEKLAGMRAMIEYQSTCLLIRHMACGVGFESVVARIGEGTRQFHDAIDAYAAARAEARAVGRTKGAE